MERKIGSEFKCRSKWYKVEKSDMSGGRCAEQCSLHGYACWDMEKQTGTCSKETRNDRNDIIFKEVTK